MLVGMTHHDLDHLKRLNESEASVDTDSRLSLVEVEARMSMDGSCTDELCGTPEMQKASESGDATDARGDAQAVQNMEDPATEQESEDGQCFG
jgi:hypothetical protein